MKKTNKWIPAFFVALACYALFTVTGSLYFDNDNLMIGVVTNGIYSDDVFCQYLHPLLCVIIRGLSFILPTADCFLVITSFFVFIEFAVLTYIALIETDGKPRKDWTIQDWILRAMLIFGTVFLSTAINIWSINYTAQSASFVFAGMLALHEYRVRNDQKALMVLGTALVTMGFMMRIEGALIFIPYVALQIVIDLIVKRIISREAMLLEVKSLAKIILPSVSIIVCLMASRTLFWSIDPHASAWKYNEARTVTGDFFMRDWEDVENVIAGTDYTEYKSPIVWSLIDTDVLDTEKLEYIAEVGSTSRFSLTPEGIFRTLKEMGWKITHTNIQLLLLFIVTLLLAVRNLVCLKVKWLKTESLFAVLGSFLIIFYFTMRGRAPLHVWQSVIFACATVLIIAAVKDVRENKTEQNTPSLANPIFLLLISAVLYFSIGQVIATGTLHAPTTAFTARIGVDESEYDETLKDDSLYIWPSFWQTLAGKYVEKGKLPSREVLDHNIPLAYWSYGQVYFTDVLERMNAENPARALLDRPNTYLVRVRGMDDFVLKYMRAHYGERIRFEEIGEINKYAYYRVVKGDEG